jgi:hypothetical protein
MPNILAVAGPNSKYKLHGARCGGFWAGYWHGIICPYTCIASGFNTGVRIYEANNRGIGYDFGFLMGAAVYFRYVSTAGPNLGT